MEIRTLNAGAGSNWIALAWQLFRTQPLGLAALTALYLAITIIPASMGGPGDLEWLGPAVALVIAPFGTCGLMAACREASLGRRASPRIFFAALRPDYPRGELVILGLWHLSLALLLTWVTSLLNLDDAVRVVTSADGNTMEDVIFNYPHLAEKLVIMAPLEMAMWFAPIYVGWHRVPAFKALLFSFYTCWRNLTPLLLYAVLMMLMVTAIWSLYLLLLKALGVGDQLVNVAAAVLMMFTAGFVMTSMYAVYRGIVADAPV